MKFYESGEALCKDMNISLSTLEAGYPMDVGGGNSGFQV